MGLSHLAMINTHPLVRVRAICDSSGYVLEVLKKYSGIPTYSDLDSMLRRVELDAVIIATPPSFHAKMVRSALDKGLHVFCEKPLCLDTREGAELVRTARQKGLVNQVGYHNRFVGGFREVKRLLDAGAIGEVTHVLAEAYGPVVLKPQGPTWRTQALEGGGCLYDYAAHPLNLVTWYFGVPQGVGGSILRRIFSKHAADGVFGSLYFAGGRSAQICVNWSDESYRKMTTSITIWGTAGRIHADRQECRVYLRETSRPLRGYRLGWNVRYATDLTEPVWFYVRGEEYSAQLDYFVRRVENNDAAQNVNSFAEALMTDKVITMMHADAARSPLAQVD